MFNHLYWPEFRKNFWNLVLNEQLFIKLYFCQNEYFINDEFKGVTPNFSKWIDLLTSRDFHPHLRRRLHHHRWLSIFIWPNSTLQTCLFDQIEAQFCNFRVWKFCFLKFFLKFRFQLLFSRLYQVMSVTKLES